MTMAKTKHVKAATILAKDVLDLSEISASCVIQALTESLAQITNAFVIKNSLTMVQ